MLELPFRVPPLPNLESFSSSCVLPSFVPPSSSPLLLSSCSREWTPPLRPEASHPLHLRSASPFGSNPRLGSFRSCPQLEFVVHGIGSKVVEWDREENW